MADKGIKYKILFWAQDQASGVAKTIDKELKAVQESAKQATNNIGNVGGQLSDISNASINNIRNSVNAGENLRRQYQSLKKEADTVSEALQKSAATSIPKFNSLNMSVQQVARELPSLAISANTFFLAISNNLPILADSISKVRKENQALLAAGQKTVPVWKQVAGSLFSWQTALVLGITALSMYGEEIISLTRNMFNASSAIDRTRIVTDALNKVQSEGVKNAQDELTKLNLLYRAATDTSQATQDRISAVKKLKELYPEHLKNIDNERIMNGKAADTYELLAQNILATAKARAAYDTIVQNQKRIFDLEQDLQNSVDPDKGFWGWADKYIPYLSKNFTLLALRMKYTTDQAKNTINEIDALKEANDKLSNSINVSDYIKSISGGKGKEQPENTNLKTIGGIENKIKSLKETQSKAMGEQAAALQKEIKLWEEKLKLMKSAIIIGASEKPDMQLLKTPEFKFNQRKLKIKSYNPKTNPYSGELLAPSGPTEKELKKAAKLAQANLQAAFKDKDTFTPMQKGIFDITDAMRGFTGAVNEAAGAWLQWGSNLLNTISQAIPAILQMVSATMSDTAATTTNANAHLKAAGAKALSANAGLGPFGWIAGVAAVAAIVGAMMSIPKLAGGTVASAPMIAMIGEYAGASNNPEIVAPSAMIRKIVREESGGLGGEVVFKIDGLTLVGMLKKMNNKMSRTR